MNREPNSLGPVFGAPKAGFRHIVRPSAYALLGDDAGRIAVVRTSRGHFLPGGGVDRDETPAAAAARETREESGLRIAVRTLLWQATEFVHNERKGVSFEKQSSFFEAELIGSEPALEVDHELLWMSPEEAGRVLHHESHRHAALQFGGRGGPAA